MSPEAAVLHCPSCGSEVAEGKRFCGDCGTPVDRTSAPTATSLKGADSTPPPDPGVESQDRARFLPGTVVAGRYRIFGLLGRGGMGEVYRADDLKLGQPVALKFLSATIQDDGGRLTRLLNEVRLARQVSHPSVCRVYDVAEVGPSTGSGQSQHFLSMEFVDGENLASLLRRIGRLPGDKAVQIARQLCAGLAAAHDQGILHRDLKPANVMIDSKGRARITDFGLAGLAESIHGEEILAGTPGYMAPEQLAGEQVSPRSDIFSLGLVLYELFTGKKAFEAAAPAELLRLQRETSPSSPSRLVEGFDPAVERVILRCLEVDPHSRPSSAGLVAAALPGGDPLAAAIAAGETPSPELVAASGGAGALRPSVALPILAAALVGLAFAVYLTPHSSFAARVRLPKQPAVLEDRAREIVTGLGSTEPPADSAFYFSPWREYVDFLRAEGRGADRWDRLDDAQPPAMLFVYRQSPDRMVPDRAWNTVFDMSRVYFWDEDPPFRRAGMVKLILDPRGRLLLFERLLPDNLPPPEEDSVPDWAQLLEYAGLDAAELTQATPSRKPPDPVTHRAAWDGVWPEAQDLGLHVEAGAYGDQIVFFEVAGQWERPLEEQGAGTTAGAFDAAVGAISATIPLVLVCALGIVASRNLRAGRGDRRGALRLAAFILIVELAAWLVSGKHVPSFTDELDLVRGQLAGTLLTAVVVWLFYLALEPHVRRLWPQTLISWSRLLTGRWRDPRVGRDLLVGAAVGVLGALVFHMRFIAPTWIGLPPAQPSFSSTFPLLGPRQVIGGLLQMLHFSVRMPLGILGLLLLLRFLLRRPVFAALALVALVSVLPPGPVTTAGERPWIAWLFGVAFAILVVGALVRFGLVALVAGWFVGGTLAGGLAFITPHLGTWYGSASLLPLALIVAIAGYGCYAAIVTPEVGLFPGQAVTPPVP